MALLITVVVAVTLVTARVVHAARLHKLHKSKHSAGKCTYLLYDIMYTRTFSLHQGVVMSIAQHTSLSIYTRHLHLDFQ